MPASSATALPHAVLGGRTVAAASCGGNVVSSPFACAKASASFTYKNTPGGRPLKLALSALLAVAFATSALAQPPRTPPVPPEKDPAKISGGAYVVEPNHTRV